MRRAEQIEIADAIVNDLFTNGFKEHAARLVMLDVHGRDIGGWGCRVIRDRIIAILAEREKATPATKEAT